MTWCSHKGHQTKAAHLVRSSGMVTFTSRFLKHWISEYQLLLDVTPGLQSPVLKSDFNKHNVCVPCPRNFKSSTYKSWGLSTCIAAAHHRGHQAKDIDFNRSNLCMWLLKAVLISVGSLYMYCCGMTRRLCYQRDTSSLQDQGRWLLQDVLTIYNLCILIAAGCLWKNLWTILQNTISQINIM